MRDKQPDDGPTEEEQDILDRLDAPTRRGYQPKVTVTEPSAPPPGAAGASQPDQAEPAATDEDGAAETT